MHVGLCRSSAPKPEEILVYGSNANVVADKQGLAFASPVRDLKSSLR